MDSSRLERFTLDAVMDYVKNTVDAVIIADDETNTYRAVKCSGMFSELLDETGSYQEMIEKLWYHLNNSEHKMVEDYRVFVPNAGKFRGKYGKRLKVVADDIPHIVQMTVYPLSEPNMYLYLLDELDSSENTEEKLTTNKVETIQSTYLFSMYIDIVRDTTSSINISEISEETMNQIIKYSDWRMMIVNMIWPDDQALFLERTDPQYLRKNFAPGRTESFDCLMKNLEGQYIWVKLIFSRTETSNEDDYRFVFMVQNIHETAVELMSTLKKYEELASQDPLTHIYNHGRIETEICNAIEARKKNDRPLALMMLDIDHFKKINDEYGHAVGDITLTHFTQTITKCIRDRSDVFGRWGGEEFVIVCYGTDKNDIASLAERIRTTVETEPFQRIGHLTCSIGTTTVSPEDDFNSAFNRMDQALYESKSSGRNRVTNA